MPFKLLNPKKSEAVEAPVTHPESGVVVGQPVTQIAKACRATVAIVDHEVKIKPEDSLECKAVEKQTEGLSTHMRKLMKRMTEP
jgi:3-oxoacyl-ACP reductase-like protein